MSCGGPPEGLGKKKAAMERRVEAKVRGGQEGRPLSPSQCEERKVMGEVAVVRERGSRVGDATCTNLRARAGAGACRPIPTQGGGAGGRGGCCGGRGGFMIENSAPGTVTDT